MLKKVVAMGITDILLIGMPFFASAHQNEIASGAKIPPAEIHATDGPRMINVNYWKHDVLDGAWMAPQGDISMEISGFDYKLGIYKLGEPDNFCWHNNRFYFAGWQNSPKREERFDLLFTEEATVKDSDGNILGIIKEMWHEKHSIFLKVKYPDKNALIIRELRKPQSIRE